MPPESKVYPLSRTESQAMEEYFKEALDFGFIRPSTSPAAAGFFFVEKDGGLRPCIDYRGLNNVTVKFRYPLSLVPSALEKLREATIYTKLAKHVQFNQDQGSHNFFISCQVCAQSKTPKKLPSGLLQPLSIPQCLWSHLSIDFVTDLPPSNDFTTILEIIDRFSKSCRLVPLKGLPTAMETAVALFNDVFQIYGLSEDIVSDQGTLLSPLKSEEHSASNLTST